MMIVKGARMTTTNKTKRQLCHKHLECSTGKTCGRLIFNSSPFLLCGKKKTVIVIIYKTNKKKLSHV